MSFFEYASFIEFKNIFYTQMSLFEYFGQSNTAGKFILFILLICSILAWSVIIGKLLQIRRLEQLNKRHQMELNKSSGVLQLDLEHLSSQAGPHAGITQVALKAYARYASVSHNQERSELDLLMGHIDNAVARSVAEQSLKYEEKMVLLGSIVTGAPFLGLLGTVWGVMDTFSGMSLAGNAALSAVAPGISGALLTTIIGLIVALPSMIGYNLLSSKIRNIAVQMDNFGQEFMSRTHNNYSIEVD